MKSLYTSNERQNLFQDLLIGLLVVESNIDGGSSIGSGLNDGILYLMAMPYLALGIIAFAWLRYNKRVKA